VAKALEHSHGWAWSTATSSRATPDRQDGRIKITDFGLAREWATRRSPCGRHGLGTPFFASPEQIQGLPADGRTDIYSLA